MTGRHVFVATELAPWLPGGAGAVVAETAARLARAGALVTVVVIADDRPATLDGAGFTVEWVEPPPPDDDAPTPYLAASRAAAAAVARLVATEPLDRVEVQDFWGLGFHLLADRHELGLDRTPVLVRVHGTIGLIADAMGATEPYFAHVDAMEAGALAMCDGIIVPSAAIGDVVVARYAVDPSRLVVGEPAIAPLAPVDRAPAVVPEFAALGRLGEAKGTDLLVDAAIEVARELPRLRVRFLGDDGRSYATGGSLRDALVARIPPEAHDAIVFEPRRPREQLPEALRTVWAVVVPSRFETFCVAAHEARALGLPVVVPDLPAFRDYFTHDTGALVVDGTVAGFADALRRLSTDPGLVAELAEAPPPSYGDPLAPYLAAAAAVRHPREQAGTATAARAALDTVLAADHHPVDRQRLVARAARAGLRWLPAPVARLAVRMLPKAAKDRFRRVASWPAEAERRDALARRAAVDRAIASGQFEELDTPHVTVVVPCFDQGRYLPDALVSVFEQTYDSWEVVVVDDGSTDPETVRTIDALAMPRVRVVRQANRGLPAARNAGVAVARGQVIVPLDADDELRPRFLDRLVGALDAAPEVAYAHCWAELFGDQDAYWVPAPFDPYRLLLSNPVVGCVAIRRDALAAVGGYAEDLARGSEDWDLWVRLSAAGLGQSVVHEPLFRYRRHGVTMSVAKESQFEALRAQLRAENPDAYAPERVRALKAEHYPWLSIIVSSAADLAVIDGQSVDDAELVVRGDVTDGHRALVAAHGWSVRDAGVVDVAGAVVAARGKTVVDGDRLRAAAPDGLARLRAAIEADDDTCGATPTPGGDALVWRRWSLVDPDGPSAPAVVVPVDVDVAAAGHGLWVGVAPARGWSVGLDLPDPDKPVLRQRPEEDGSLPAWLLGADVADGAEGSGR